MVAEVLCRAGCAPPASRPSAADLLLAEIYDKVESPRAPVVGVRLVREESGDYEVEYEFEGGLYANRPDPPGLHR